MGDCGPNAAVNPWATSQELSRKDENITRGLRLGSFDEALAVSDCVDTTIPSIEKSPPKSTMEIGRKSAVESLSFTYAALINVTMIIYKCIH